MKRDPSLKELRSRVFKHSAGGVELGSWLARRVARPSAVYGTWIAVRFPVSAHAVTVASLVSGFAGAIALGSGSRRGFIAGVALLHLAYWLDHVDGQVARWRGTSSLEGVYLDYLMHHAQAMALGFGLGFGPAMRSGRISWTIAGFLVAMGWTFLNLHNDCRYKAFFQKLKRDGENRRLRGQTRVQTSSDVGGTGRSWKSAIRLGQKACEPHVVLMGLSFMGVLAIVAPRIWWLSWQVGVALMAVLAPTLAVGRAAKAIVRGTLETEFDSWFPGGSFDGKMPLAARGTSAARG